MENTSEILHELKTLSPVLAGMEKVSPFTVPAGYFQRLAQDILLSVKDENDHLLQAAVIHPSAAPVPTGYFDSLADNILNNIRTQETPVAELKGLSPLLHGLLAAKNVFEVPTGYFESLAIKVAAKIKSGDENIPEELLVISPLLHSLAAKNVFEVPTGYFETLPDIILNKVTTRPQQTKVVTMRSRSVTFFKYAVAAVFTGAMVLGVYKFAGNSVKVTGLPDYVAAGQKISNIEEEITKVSDDDIIKYLETNGENIDTETVAANITNDNELPSEEDYMTDDKALDNYLDNIDINDLKN
jgi:hypothetical protein